MIRSSACQQQADTHPTLWDEPWSSKLHHVLGHDLRYPLGWDLYLVDGKRLLGIPRSTKIEVL
ncbi:phosphonate C-P lyase system protein PhnH [Rhizobium sp. BR 314]|uniref:phosphonate C-P lyase system protein PhnH n=1 Tax=Rhizobium sp. BR 314 TaxID=3040013 RepID=UPI0039BFD84B